MADIATTKETTMTEIGPVQMIAVAFGPDAKFEGRIIEELAKLEGERTIRVLDLLFVLKDPEGSGDLVVLDHQGEDLGAIVGALLGFDFAEEAGERARAKGAGDRAFGLSPSEIEAVGAQLEPGHSAGFLLIEHVWARDLKRAIRDAGGVPVAEGFLTQEAVRAVEPELAAMADALDEIQAEEAGAPASP
jgi:uncharacterized membrane protein